MRLLVHPHLMEMGGSQFNAIELADAVGRRGHEVVVYGPPGVLVEEVRRRGIEYVAAPAERRMDPSAASVVRLTRLARRRRFDLVHAYEGDATLDSLFGPGLIQGVPVLSTIMSMGVTSVIPPSVPMIVGTRGLLDSESSRRSDVTLMEPPVDTMRNRPGACPFVTDSVGKVPVRQRWRIPPADFLIVLVGRLSPGLKIGGVLEAVRAMELLPADLRGHLLVVGDGPMRAEVEGAAHEVNARSSRRLVTLTGLVMDPRSVYDAADLVLGMGGSILRGLAFGKPAIVQGERGFWEPVEPSTVDQFLYGGWCGFGDGSDGAARLARLISSMCANPEAMSENATFGRHLIEDRFSLEGAARQLEELYERVAAQPIGRADRIRTGADATRRMVRSSAAIASHRMEKRLMPQMSRTAEASPSWS